MEPQDVNITLKFLEWQALYEIEKPFQIFINIPEDAVDQRNTNLVFKDVPLLVQDVRKFEDQASIDDVGFIYRRFTTTFSDFENCTAVESLYLPEVERLLKTELDGVDRVFFFDWRVIEPTVVL